MNDKKVASILKEVKRYFGYLYDMDYEVKGVDYHPESSGNWEVVLETQDSILEICKDRGEIMVYFVPLNRDRRYRIGIKAVIYYLTQGQKFIDFYNGNLFWGKNKQFQELAKLLKDYIEQITPYFGNRFHAYREDLLSAQRDHFRLAAEHRMKENKN